MKLSRVFSNTGWILFGSAFNKISSIILLYVLSRYLGAKGFGKFSFAFFYIALFSSIAEMGLTPILIKYIKTDYGKGPEVLGKGILLGFFATVTAILLAWGGTYVFNFEKDVQHLIFAASIALMISFRDINFRWILEAPFRASLRMGWPVLIGVSSELLSLLLVLFAVYKGSSIQTIVSIYVLGNLPGFLLLTLLSARQIRPSLKAGGLDMFSMMKEATPIGASNILITIYLVIGSLILFKLRGADQVGYYAMAFRLAISLRILPEAMMHSAFPLLAKAHLNDPLRVKAIFRTAMRYGAFLAFPLALGTMAVAGDVTVLLGGEEFQPAALALSILIWATFLAFFNTILRFTFNAVSLQRYNLWMSIGMVFSSIILSFLFIPSYGFIGASYALVFSEGVGLACGLFIANSFELTVPFKMMIKYLIASFVMAAGIWYLPYLLLKVVTGIIIYLAISFILGGIKKEEICSLITFKVS